MSRDTQLARHTHARHPCDPPRATTRTATSASAHRARAWLAQPRPEARRVGSERARARCERHRAAPRALPVRCAQDGAAAVPTRVRLQQLARTHPVVRATRHRTGTCGLTCLRHRDAAKGRLLLQRVSDTPAHVSAHCQSKQSLSTATVAHAAPEIVDPATGHRRGPGARVQRGRIHEARVVRQPLRRVAARPCCDTAQCHAIEHLVGHSASLTLRTGSRCTHAPGTPATAPARHASLPPRSSRSACGAIASWM